MTYSEHRKSNRKISGMNFMTYFNHYRKNNRKNRVFRDEIRNTKSTIFSDSISKMDGGPAWTRTTDLSLIRTAL